MCSLSGCQQTAAGDGKPCKYHRPLQTLRDLLRADALLIMAVCTPHRSSPGIQASPWRHSSSETSVAQLPSSGTGLFLSERRLTPAGFGSDVRLTLSSFMLRRLQFCSYLIRQKQHGVFSDHERIVGDIAVAFPLQAVGCREDDAHFSPSRLLSKRIIM